MFSRLGRVMRVRVLAGASGFYEETNLLTGERAMTGLLYAADVAAGLKIIIIILFVLLGIATVALLVAAQEHYTESRAPLYAKAKTCAKIALALIILFVFIPTKQTVYMMAAAHYATNLEGMAEMPANLTEFINSFLKEQTKGLAKQSEATPD
jgi:glucan phosphoethanolaminetransferase (alkaline phosphatase superfamily)